MNNIQYSTGYISGLDNSFFQQNKKRIFFLSLLVFGQIGRVTFLLRQRDPHQYSSIDTTNTISIVILLIAIAVLVKDLNKLKIVFFTPLKFYCWYFFYCAVTAFWSHDPIYSIYMILESVTYFFFLIYIFSFIYDRIYALKYLLWFSTLACLFGLLSTWMVSGIGFQHSNSYPFACAVTAVIAIGCITKRILSLKEVALPLLISITGLILGTSSGSNVAFCIGILYLMIQHRNPEKLFLKTIFILILCSILLTSYQNEIQEILFPGKDIQNIRTMTGRTAIWENYYDVFLDNPIWGYGYPTGEKELKTGVFAGSGINQTSHNMLMSVAINTGSIGLFLFLLAMYKIISTSISFIRTGENDGVIIPAALIVALINSLTIPVLGSQWFWMTMIVNGCFAYGVFFLWTIPGFENYEEEKTILNNESDYQKHIVT